MNINDSIYETDESRIDELRELFALLEEKEKKQEFSWSTLDFSCFDHIIEALEIGLNRVGRIWNCDTRRNRSEYVETITLPLFKVLNAFRKHLIDLRITPTQSPLVSQFKHVLRTYQMIKHPNHLVVIQPKLQSINYINSKA